MKLIEIVKLTKRRQSRRRLRSPRFEMLSGFAERIYRVFGVGGGLGGVVHSAAFTVASSAWNCWFLLRIWKRIFASRRPAAMSVW